MRPAGPLGKIGRTNSTERLGAQTRSRLRSQRQTSAKLPELLRKVLAAGLKWLVVMPQSRCPWWDYEGLAGMGAPFFPFS